MIDQGVVDIFTSASATPRDIAGLDYIALGVAEGSHRLIGSRAGLLALARCNMLQQKSRDVFMRAYNRMGTEGVLLKKLKIYGIVIANTTMVDPVSTISGEKRVISFPLRWFDASKKIQSTLLLGEDLYDVDVLIKIGEAGTVLANIGYLPLKHDEDHGGGGSTARVLNSNVIKERLCVCVVDSDRACPSGTMGNTALAVQPFKNQANFPLVGVIETTGRDLENMLPDTFYRTEYGHHRQYGRMVMVFEALTQRNETDLRAHIDVEKGVTLHQIFRHATGSPETLFWNTKIGLLFAILGGSQPTTVACHVNGRCTQASNSLCPGCVVIQGNNDNILERFATRYANVSRHTLCKCLDNSTTVEWTRIGENIAAWCCGDDKLRL